MCFPEARERRNVSKDESLLLTDSSFSSFYQHHTMEGLSYLTITTHNQSISLTSYLHAHITGRITGCTLLLFYACVTYTWGEVLERWPLWKCISSLPEFLSFLCSSEMFGTFVLWYVSHKHPQTCQYPQLHTKWTSELGLFCAGTSYMQLVLLSLRPLWNTASWVWQSTFFSFCTFFGLTEQSVFVTSGGLKFSVVLTSIYLIKRLFKVVIYPSRADCLSPNSVA